MCIQALDSLREFREKPARAVIDKVFPVFFRLIIKNVIAVLVIHSRANQIRGSVFLFLCIEIMEYA